MPAASVNCIACPFSVTCMSNPTNFAISGGIFLNMRGSRTLSVLRGGLSAPARENASPTRSIDARSRTKNRQPLSIYDKCAEYNFNIMLVYNSCAVIIYNVFMIFCSE